MSARRLTRAALAAGAATAVGIGALALGQQSSSAVDTATAADADDTVIGRHAQERNLDFGSRGESVGDRFVFSENLYEEGSNDRLGRLGAFCDITAVKRNSNNRVTDGFMQCIGTFRFGDGQVTGQGAWWWSADTAELAITGGTGRYDDAAGTVNLKFPTEKRTVYDFDFENNNGGTIVG